MEKIFVDTGALMAFFVETDGRHEIAMSIYEKLKKSKAILYTSDYIVDETLTLILMRANHMQSVLAGKSIFESAVVKIVSITPDYFQRTWDQFQKYKDKKLSFTDVSTICVMESLKIKRLFSFDKEFEKVNVELLTASE